MVFIAIGALKAAKAAKKEYEKDKKRSQIIAPLDSSRRNEFDNAPASASPDWWSSDQPPESEPQRPQVSHNAFGAWSRDQLMEHVAEQQSRQEDFDARFREELSNSSASLGSHRVPSASHSPSLAVAPTRPELEQAHHSESPKQVLPPAISPPSLEKETEEAEASAAHTNASDSASRVLKTKPPRPAKQYTYVEGSYEAVLKASSTSFQQTKEGASSAAASSSGGMRVQASPGDDSISQTRTASRARNAPELLDGSFESALRNGTATARYPPMSSLSDSDGANQPRAPSTSAFPSSAKPKRLGRQGAIPVHSMNATSREVEDAKPSQTVEKQAFQSSAFANASTTKRAIRRPPGSSNGLDIARPVLSKTMGSAEGSNLVQAAPGSAFQQEGLCAKTRRKPRDATATGPRAIPPPRTTPQSYTNAASDVLLPSTARGSAVAGASCMSAEGTMKKRRGKQPPHGN